MLMQIFSVRGSRSQSQLMHTNSLLSPIDTGLFSHFIRTEMTSLFDETAAFLIPGHYSSEDRCLCCDAFDEGFIQDLHLSACCGESSHFSCDCSISVLPLELCKKK